MAAYKNATATVLPVHAFAVKVWALRLGKRTDVQITQLEDKLAQGSLEADTTLETLMAANWYRPTAPLVEHKPPIWGCV